MNYKEQEITLKFYKECAKIMDYISDKKQYTNFIRSYNPKELMEHMSFPAKKTYSWIIENNKKQSMQVGSGHELIPSQKEELKREIEEFTDLSKKLDSNHKMIKIVKVMAHKQCQIGNSATMYYYSHGIRDKDELEITKFFQRMSILQTESDLNEFSAMSPMYQELLQESFTDMSNSREWSEFGENKGLPMQSIEDMLKIDILYGEHKVKNGDNDFFGYQIKDNPLDNVVNDLCHGNLQEEINDVNSVNLNKVLSVSTQHIPTYSGEEGEMRSYKNLARIDLDVKKAAKYIYAELKSRKKKPKISP
jgi:hypothetical protein